jgi:hypothetical protein
LVVVVVAQAAEVVAVLVDWFIIQQCQYQQVPIPLLLDLVVLKDFLVELPVLIQVLME